MSEPDNTDLIDFLDVINIGLGRASRIVEQTTRGCDLESIGATWGFNEGRRFARTM